MIGMNIHETDSCVSFTAENTGSSRQGYKSDVIMDLYLVNDKMKKFAASAATALNRAVQVSDQ